MEELRKKRNELFNKKVALFLELKRVSRSLMEVEVKINIGRLDRNKREEEK